MSNYGRAVIEAVPTGSIVVSNYDMQWAAIRYLRECEMIRPDIITLNLSLMTYRWFSTIIRRSFQSQRNVVFPGTHLVAHSCKATGATKDPSQPQCYGGFTFGEFLGANLGRRQVGASEDAVSVLLGGSVPFGNDVAFHDTYESVAIGLLQRLYKRGDAPDFST